MASIDTSRPNPYLGRCGVITETFYPISIIIVFCKKDFTFNPYLKCRDVIIEFIASAF